MMASCRHRDVSERGMALERCLRDAVHEFGGRWYCANHVLDAEIEMNKAKDAVLAAAAKLVETTPAQGARLPWPPHAEYFHALALAVEELEKTSWGPGD